MFVTKGPFDKLSSHQKSGYSSWDVLIQGASIIKLLLFWKLEVRGCWDIGQCCNLTRGDAYTGVCTHIHH